MLGEKPKWELLKNVACCFQQILEAAPYKTHHLKSKDKLRSNVLLWTSTHKYTSVGQLTKAYIHQLCSNTGCHLEDLPKTIANGDRWQKGFNGFYAGLTSLFKGISIIVGNLMPIPSLKKNSSDIT